jgi:hypothetical protein
VGCQLVALDLEEELRARADDLERGRPDEEQVRAGIHPTKRPIEGHALQRSAGRRIERQPERLASGEDDLDRLT